MTVPQFLNPLDALALVGCCERRKKRDGTTTYTMTLHDVHEGGLILSGECSTEDAGCA